MKRPASLQSARSSLAMSSAPLRASWAISSAAASAVLVQVLPGTPSSCDSALISGNLEKPIRRRHLATSSRQLSNLSLRPGCLRCRGLRRNHGLPHLCLGCASAGGRRIVVSNTLQTKSTLLETEKDFDAMPVRRLGLHNQSREFAGCVESTLRATVFAETVQLVPKRCYAFEFNYFICISLTS